MQHIENDQPYNGKWSMVIRPIKLRVFKLLLSLRGRGIIVYLAKKINTITKITASNNINKLENKKIQPHSNKS